jgi:hypothetical protein
MRIDEYVEVERREGDEHEDYLDAVVFGPVPEEDEMG